MVLGLQAMKLGRSGGHPMLAGACRLSPKRWAGALFDRPEAVLLRVSMCSRKASNSPLIWSIFSTAVSINHRALDESASTSKLL